MTSTDYQTAAAAGSVTRTPAKVEADWNQDGYGGAGTIDDLSGFAGQIQVARTADDGLPEPVHRTANEPGATADLSAAADGTSPSRYFSEYNATSPVYGYHRDVAPVRIKSGLVTAVGEEEVTIYTGQMSDLPVQTGQATLQSISAARLKLTKALNPPAITRLYSGLTASWPVSWALAQCGLYVSPPPRSGCLLWSPMHGSLQPFLPYQGGLEAASSNDRSYVRSPTDTSASPVFTTFTDGPFLAAVDAFADATGYRQAQHDRSVDELTRLTGNPNVMSSDNNKGRVEFYVRGDAYDLNATPGGSGGGGAFSSGVVSVVFSDDNLNSVTVGVDATRHAYVQVVDGSHTSTLTSAGTVPTDGAWYAVGAAWDLANNKLWINLAGTLATSTPSPAITTANLLPEATSLTAVFIFAGIPAAEFQVTSGTQASPDSSAAWIFDNGYFTPGVVAMPSLMDLEALIQQTPVEAYEFIRGFADGELAQTRFDEQDRFCYLPRSYWAKTAQQTVVETITAAQAINTLKMVRDPRRIVNTVTVTFPLVLPDLSGFGVSTTPVLQSTSTYQIPLGTSYLTLAPDVPITTILPSDSTTGQITNGTAAMLTGTPGSVIFINAQPDGSGVYAAADQVTVYITDNWTPGQIELKFVNHTGQVWYVASTDTSQQPLIQIEGDFATQVNAAVTYEESVSVAARGVRGITVDLPAVNRADMALRAAAQVALRYSQPVTQFDSIKVFGDASRTPGELVHIADTTDTGIDLVGRVLTIDDSINQADYTQDLQVVDAPRTATWGTARWGQSLWNDGT